MTKTVVSGFINKDVKKSVGQGYTAEFVGQDAGYLPVGGGYKITLNDIRECNIVCQAWDYDDAITCVTIGLGSNAIYVTTLNNEGKFVPTPFCFIATEYTYSEDTY
ncbi:MAG: hypothetical protein AAF383_13010 [Cyanobacteria bacterium P01_A01_bin.83]